MTQTHISPAMRQAVGTEFNRTVSHPVSDSDIRKWAIAVYWPEPPPSTYLTTPDGGPLSAPEEFNPFAWTVAESHSSATEAGEVGAPDATERRVGIEGPGLTKMLNGGMSAEYGVPIRSGDVITSRKRLGPYSERSGRLGLMLLSSTEDEWTNQRGELVKRTVMTLIRY